MTSCIAEKHPVRRLHFRFSPLASSSSSFALYIPRVFLPLPSLPKKPFFLYALVARERLGRRWLQEISDSKNEIKRQALEPKRSRFLHGWWAVFFLLLLLLSFRLPLHPMETHLEFFFLMFFCYILFCFRGAAFSFDLASSCRGPLLGRWATFMTDETASLWSRKGQLWCTL